MQIYLKNFCIQALVILEKIRIFHLHFDETISTITYQNCSVDLESVTALKIIFCSCLTMEMPNG